MDASQYLRRLAEKCPKTISRNTCVDASLYTQMKGLAATTTYIPPASVENVANGVVPLPCELGRDVGFGAGNSGSVEPVKPPASCPSQGVCDFFNNRYTTPTIQLPGCSYPTVSTSYVSVACIPCVQGTTEEQRRAVKIRVDRDIHGCC